MMNGTALHVENNFEELRDLELFLLPHHFVSWNRGT